MAFETILESAVMNMNIRELPIIGEDAALILQRAPREELSMTGQTFEVTTISGGSVDAVLTDDANTIDDNNNADGPVNIARITLPPSLFDEAADDQVGLAFTFYESSNLFPLANGTRSGAVIGSSVIGALVAGKDVLNLEDPVIITLTLLDSRFFNPVCVSWDFTAAGGEGNWTQEGCELANEENGLVSCECNHLTNFGVLVDVCSLQGGCRLTQAESVGLEAVSIIGAVLSTFGLIATIVTMLAFRKLRKRDASKFHIQLCIAILGVLLVLLIGVPQTEVKGICVTASVLLHYFTLASVMWMAAEALLMFQKLVIVFVQITTKYIVILSLICWLSPIILVIIPLGIDPDFMVTFEPQDVNLSVANITADPEIRYCFIGRFEVLVGALLAPVLAVIAFNVVVFVIVISVLIKHSKKKIKRAQANADGTSKPAIIRLMISIFSIMNIYGLTWLFGIFTFIEGSNTAFQFLFAIFNSLQGFFMFLFFCVLGKEARESWAKVFCRGKLKKFAPSTSSSRPAAQVSSSAQANTARRYSAQTTANTLLRSTDISGAQSRRSSYSVDTLRSIRHQISEEPSSSSGICEESDSAVPDLIEFNRQAIAVDTLERSRPSLAVAPMLTVHEEDENEEPPRGKMGVSNTSDNRQNDDIGHNTLGAGLTGVCDSASVSDVSLAESGIMLDDEMSYDNPDALSSPPLPPGEQFNQQLEGPDVVVHHDNDEDFEESTNVVRNPHAH